MSTSAKVFAQHRLSLLVPNRVLDLCVSPEWCPRFAP